MKEKFEIFYNEHLQKFGSTAQGVGWKNEAAQKIRFAQLSKIIKPGNEVVSLNDLGCGVGDFIDFLTESSFKFSYRGYDIMPAMIDLTKIKFGHLNNAVFEVIKSANEMQVSNYTIASGIFNIKFDSDDGVWLKYILDTLSVMNDKSTDGFAFNILTRYSDPEFMKKELYYADPGFIFDFCKKNFSKNVALLHDYDQYDFTILVRK